MSKQYFENVARQLRLVADIFDSLDKEKIESIVGNYSGAYCAFDAPYIDIDLDELDDMLLTLTDE